MSFADNLKKKLAEQQKKQAEAMKTPNSSEAKKTARMGGAALFVIGLAFAVANYWTWTTQGSAWILAIACMIAFLGLGLYAMITGKMPKKRM